ncbi:GTP-binding protein [Phenylobacterium sp.]|jgi:G3E family GTPase|uniref:CobW family GTP-binding protein n=1 Tax=Phenylobacterium sp. TaxID=1871053 RepID=UPI002F40FCF3
MTLIPATVLTGFLGAGKSTLLRRVLTEAHGRKIAVIENEFGEENIDSEIIVSGGAEQIIQLSNGCLCCGIRDDLRLTLADLAERRRAGEFSFDQVVIETTGLADPGPIAQTFFLEPAITADYRPDAVLTLVDAKHAMEQLDTRCEARRQVGFADRLFISKSDLVSDAELEALSSRLRRMNPRAPQSSVAFGDVALSEVFDIGGFNLTPDLEFAPPEPCCDDHGDGHAGHHHHDDDVKSFVFRSERPFHPVRFGQLMNAIVQSHGPALLRYKGVLHMAGLDRKVIFQGVHQLMSHDAGSPWLVDDRRESKLVFIGLDLPQAQLTRSLQQCLV